MAEKKYVSYDDVKHLWGKALVAFPKKGDVTLEIGNKFTEIVGDLTALKTDAKTTVVAALNEVHDEVTVLDAYVGDIPSDEAYKGITNVIAYINKKAEETLSAATGGSSESAASVLAALNSYKAENDSKVTANIEAITAIKDGTSIDSFKDVEGADAALSARIDTLVGGTSGDNAKSARTIANEEATAAAEAMKDAILGEGISETFDTLKEIQTWIEGDGVNATELTEAIAGEAAIREQADTELGNRITLVEEAMHTHENKALLDTYTQTEANLADAVAKKHSHKNATVLDGITSDKVTAWDTAESNAKNYADGLFNGITALTTDEIDAAIAEAEAAYAG